MFPLYDENPIRITPYFTYGLIGLNIVVFLHEVSLSSEQLEQFFGIYAVIPRELTTNFALEWTTLFTSQFLHGGWWHLISNMVFLWVFGNNIEDRMGHFKYLIFYLACGALAGLCQWFISMDSTIPSLGASGAIAGILGAYVIRFPQSKIFTLLFLGFFVTTIRIPAMILIGLFVIQNVISGLLSLEAAANMTVESGGVAYWAHIGGFAFGLILAPLFGLFRRD
ncbi:rhomboid family intramembrane serine protease [Nodularia spumigena CS-584]|uniref:Rhomboid family intramembrane serine protease n=1 Tax=Nodularia spumigena UHCC 0060 TaxID=3110300 RepID=A0ABU5UWM9_NODSP|nr:rhomboid family intramembrane serine protease [Nodularia spumigena]EAW42909.1 Rhomboid-like protein [Nodularia spumigena CCY9414]MDB9381387.1 rhomboid family intramembrane serine protease [Nodularia spumigena CS-584]MEA5526853.1 rhomboid family intramembrane serine protease [Nodularia spumigena UHCC 0143]MEA5556432.1 rhomboid family intramembrane serine protease [Nodularia spumigena CH309]MEA5610718.1 rhomboid family intramembrane serine protease [Nodularia spumigena UHCC 0060]